MNEKNLTLDAVIARIGSLCVVGEPARWLKLSYCDKSKIESMRKIDVDGIELDIVCDSENGSWEWIARKNGVVKVHSNAGYCNQAAVIREALMFLEYGEWEK